MKCRVIFLFLLTLLCVAGVAQSFTYDVYLFGDKIGSSTITRKVDSNTIQYSLRSHSVAEVFFFKRVSQQDYDVVYRNGKLDKVTAYNKVDDKTTVVKVIFDGTRYCVDKNKVCYTFMEPVAFSSLCLYFFEPQPNQRIFSEREAEFYNIKKNEDGAFTYTLSDGVKNTFYYTNGMVTKVELKKSMITVELKLVNKSN
ncbi:MAG: DUF6134 family protein [Chitinophagales bacterium]